jgi:hypothetical protein
VKAAPLPEKPAVVRPRALSVPKARGQRNEDAWQFSRKGVAALSDGASVSFDSASWARILVRRYAQNPCFDAGWLAVALAEFAELHERESLPWMQQAAFDRGSFASLLGLRRRADGWVRILAIGDSIAVLCDADRVVATFPYEAAEQFDERPVLLSTNPAQNAFLTEHDPACDFGIDWDVGALESPALICATDALGHWIIVHRNECPSPIAALRAIGSRREFTRFVAAERAAGRMRLDDTTLLAYWDW